MPQRKKWGVFLLAALLLNGCASHPRPMGYPPSSLATPVSPVVMPVFTPFSQPRTLEHTVGPSETLWRISKVYNVDMATLMRVNQIDDANKIKNGQKLIIPYTLGPRPVIPLYPSRKWQYIVIHHTATDVGDAFFIDQLHHKRGFWNGLGYHFLIDNGTAGKLMGQIEVGPRWIKQQDGAHAKDSNMNIRGIGIGVVGNYSETPIPGQQFDSLVFLVKTLQGYYDIPNRNVIGHREVPGAKTECPGTKFPWRRFKQSLR